MTVNLLTYVEAAFGFVVAVGLGFHGYRKLRRAYKQDIHAAISVVPHAAPRGWFKIAIVDDNVGTLFTAERRKVLRKRGFRVNYFKDITNIQQLDSHDIVLCDVQGVGNRLSLDGSGHGGLILHDMRVKRPLVYIILYSGAANYDPEFNKFFAKADDSKNLTSIMSEDRLVNILDDAMSKICSPKVQWARFCEYYLKARNVILPEREQMKLKKRFDSLTPEQSASIERLLRTGTSEPAAIDDRLRANPIADLAKTLEELSSL